MRPRERYLLNGPDGLPARELLALILGTGAGGRTTLELGDALLERFGGLAGLRAAPPGALASIHGIGSARAVRLHAALVLGGRDPGAHTGHTVHTPDDAFAVLGPRLRGLQHEELHGLYIDRNGRVRHVRRLTSGTDHCTLVEPRQILQPAIQLGVPRLVLAHNHPSGVLSPSEADLRSTRRVARAAEVLNIVLVDHLIVAGNAFTSLASLGAIPASVQGGLTMSEPLSPSGSPG